jgi:predicted RNase H-like nuclease (RuvC/YqgF family)
MSADEKAAAAWDDYVSQQQEEKIEELERQLNAANKRIKRLEREVELLRLYGNKDCTAQADEVLKKEAKP